MADHPADAAREPGQRLLPLFPLNTVVFPGTAVPLHVFEERYRAMVRDLLAIPARQERLFGIVAIREGYEVGNHEARSMYRVGCVVQLTHAEELHDGRFAIAAVGRHRMRVLGTDTARPYLRAEVAELAGDDGPERSRREPNGTAEEAARTLAVFERYAALVSRFRGEDIGGALPRDPSVLVWTLASSVGLPLRERQQLLESPSTLERLGLLRRLLTREVGAMQAIPSLPATEVARTRWSPN